MKEELTYTAAFEELRTIVSEIEQGDVTVDILAEKVKRASVLIAFCKQTLRTTEEDVKSILQELENNNDHEA
ncbi:MAG: exodeoxyribonuclease VII small subunit [Flavobacteriales bacterium]|jgi:exodeoxyribonuclease VII small subunit